MLYPIAICDALMSVAATGVCAVKWTRRIEREWTLTLERNRGAPAGTFDFRRDQMTLVCPDWEVPAAAWETLVAGIELPDPDDRHVLAAAIAGHADCIVTANLRDFPAECLSPRAIEAIHPDTFLASQLDLDPFVVLPAFKQIRARLKRPACTPAAFADALERNGLPATAQFLRQTSELI